MQKPLLYIGGDRFVAFKNHNGIPALFAAVKLHCGDVYLPLHQRSCNCRNVPGNVLIVNDKRVVLAVEVRFDSVNITYVNTSAPMLSATISSILPVLPLSFICAVLGGRFLSLYLK